MTRRQVPVLDRDRKLLGYVSQSATSVAASKIAGGPVQFSRRFGDYALVKI
jgi:hypothetical protein